jgi:glucose-1-phosphate cytidylyltransferase
MKVIILAGGLGTRISEETNDKPKPMVLIDDKPILWHLMNIFGSQGFDEFVLALGYRSDVIKRCLLDLNDLSGDIKIDTWRRGPLKYSVSTVSSITTTFPSAGAMMCFGLISVTRLGTRKNCKMMR